MSALADPHALGERDEVRRQVRARAQPVALAGSPRSSAPSSSCRWSRRRGSPGTRPAAGRARSAAAASGPGRSACRTARGRAGSARRRRSSSGPPWPAAAITAPRAGAAGRPACRARPATTSGGALATKPCVGELGLGAVDLGLQPRALLGALALELGGVDARAPPARRRRRRPRRRPGRPTPAAPAAPARRASSAKPSARATSRSPGAIPAASRHARTARTVSISSPTCRLGLGVEAGRRATSPRRACASSPSVPGHVRPDLLGHERDHRVRERQRLAQHVEHRGRQRSSNSRPLTSSRYQSHSSP